MAAQTIKWDPNTTLEKEDIQGLLVRGYSKLPYASYHLLRFNDLLDTKSYLQKSIPQITKASTSPDDLAVHLAFTYEGLKYLSLPEKTLRSFLRQFKEGMTEKHRSFVLGDEHVNSPELWEWGGPSNATVHALLMLYAKDNGTLEAAQSQHHNLFGHHQIEEVRMLATETLPNLKEHFGFRDGISQPYVGGFSSKQHDANEDILPPGEFILGYKNWYDQFPDSPILETVEDADDLLPNHPNNHKVKDFGKNGSYLVFRQLSQDVSCFWKYMKEQTASASDGQNEAVKLASKMVGRWPSGAPLVKAPQADNGQYANDNDFNYWKEDFNGLKCPIGAHIRRTNPRDSLLTEKTDLESKEMVLKHRILRRGRTYGTPLAESMKTEDLMDAADDGKERGLHFICFVGDLIRQFEFIQNAWVKFHKFGGLYEDSDPLIGTHYQKDGHVTDTFTVPEEPVRKRYKNMPQFTAVKGGAYFFFSGYQSINLPVQAMKELGKEEIPLHEDEHIEEIIQDMQGFLERTYAPGKTKRHFHPKMHGCLKATFEVKDGLPSNLKKGLFSIPKTYDAWVRFSSAPPKEASDKKPSGLGMAIKVMDVAGDFIEPNAEKAQDFLMTTSPVLSPGHVANYRRAMKMLIYGLPHAIFYVLDPGNWRRIALTLKYRKRFYNVLEQMYFSGAPILFGEGTAVKYGVKPHKAKTSGKPHKGTDFFLQQRLMEDMDTKDAYFDFMVQFQEDPASEPIEDTSRQWKTTFQTLATICIPKQEFSSQERITLGENLQFNPWHALKSHRPLGGINRARKAVYGILADFRKQRNGVGF